MKYLIINADDFGYSKIFNIKILELIKDGLVSSTSAMVNWINDEQADQVKELSGLMRKHNVSVGLHLEFLDNDFKPEIEKQYERFFSIFGAKPSHVDLHKSKYFKEAYPLIMDFCRENKIPCRNHGIDFSDIVKTLNVSVGGTKMSFDELKMNIESFKEGESYELVFHPGTYDPDSKSLMNKEREGDVEKIEKINPLLKENNIKLISYLDLI